MAPLYLALTNAGINPGAPHDQKSGGRAGAVEHISPRPARTHRLVPAQADTQRVDRAVDPPSFPGRAHHVGWAAAASFARFNAPSALRRMTLLVVFHVFACKAALALVAAQKPSGGWNGSATIRKRGVGYGRRPHQIFRRESKGSARRNRAVTHGRPARKRTGARKFHRRFGWRTAPFATF